MSKMSQFFLACQEEAIIPNEPEEYNEYFNRNGCTVAYQELFTKNPIRGHGGRAQLPGSYTRPQSLPQRSSSRSEIPEKEPTKTICPTEGRQGFGEGVQS